MSTTLVVDRYRVCAFLSPGGRGCTMPLSYDHPFLCTYHARKEAQASADHKVGQNIAYSLSTRYISHNDLAVALAQSISATAQRHISSRTASSIANLSRNLLQAIAGAQHEYIETFGDDAWTEKIAQNLNSLRPAPETSEPSARSVSRPAVHGNQSHSAEDDQNEETGEQQVEEQVEAQDGLQNEEHDDEEYEVEDEPPAVTQMTNYWATLNRNTNPTPVPKREPA